MEKRSFLFKPVLSNVDSGYSIEIQHFYIILIRVRVAYQISQLIIKLKWLIKFKWFGKAFL